MRKIFAALFLLAFASFASAQKPVGSSATVATEWSNELGSQSVTLSNGSADTTVLWTLGEFSTNLSVTKISYNISTADNSADTYDIGLYNPSGTLVCHIGATAGTTFAPSANPFTLSFTSTCNLSAGIRYTFAMTKHGVTGTAALYGTNRRLMPMSAVAPSAGSATSGGALNASITLPADSWPAGSGGNTGPPWISLHN